MRETEANPNLTPADALLDIIARGVAAYQESLPDFARNKAPNITLPAHARVVDSMEPVATVAEVAEARPETAVITLSEERQRDLCLSCTLRDCVGVESAKCPIRIETRRRWREASKHKAEKVRREAPDGRLSHSL